MQVAIETGKGLSRTLKITIPNDDIEQKIGKEVRDFAKKARIDGFRPGKVPESFVRKRFGESIREQVVGQMMEENIDNAIKQESLDVATITKVDRLKDVPGENFEYATEIEVYPEIKLNDLSKETITEYKVDIADADVEDMMLRLRKQKGEWNEVKRAAKNDDQVIIDFEGKINGEGFTGNSGTDVPLVLGSKSMLPGFEEGIVKHKAGDKFTIDLDFPKDYPSAEVAGKTAQFEITLHKVNEQSLPELDAEFAKTMGYEDGVDALTNAMREDMQKTVDKAIFEKVKKEVNEALVKAHKVEVPQELLSRMKENQIQQTQQQTGRTDLSDDYLEKLDSELTEQLKFDLIVRQYIRDNNVKLDDNRFSQKMAEVVSSSPFGAEMLQYIAKDPQRRAQIEQMALEDQVVDAILETAKRKAETISYQAALGIEQDK